MTFGDRLRNARLQKGLTQEQLAQQIGVAKSTLTGYEKGNREPDVFKIKKILDVLELESDYLLGIDRVKNSPEPAATDSEDKEELIFKALKKLFADLNIDISRLTERQKVVLQVLAELLVQNF